MAWSARTSPGAWLFRLLVQRFVNSVEADPAVQGRIAAFRQALERLGWLEGCNIHIELRFSAANYERLPQLAHEMVALNLKTAKSLGTAFSTSILLRADEVIE
jgi:hypothetical protein